MSWSTRSSLLRSWEDRMLAARACHHCWDLLHHLAETAGLKTSEIFYFFWQKTRVTNFIWVQVQFINTRRTCCQHHYSHQPPLQDWILSASVKSRKTSSTRGPWKGQTKSLKHTSKNKYHGMGESCHGHEAREAMWKASRGLFLTWHSVREGGTAMVREGLS